MSLRKEIMSDLTKSLADNQKEMLKLMAPAIEKTSIVQNLENSDSKPNTTSTPFRSKTYTSKTTAINSRNNK